jgi:hypothetical protein
MGSFYAFASEKKAAEKEAPTAHPYHFVKKIEPDLFT